MKNMLSQEDLSQIQELIESGVKAGVWPLQIAIADIKVSQQEMKVELEEKMVTHRDTILTVLDRYAKNVEDLAQEQKISGDILHRNGLA